MKLALVVTIWVDLRDTKALKGAHTFPFLSFPFSVLKRIGLGQFKNIPRLSLLVGMGTG
jgi:hypothetical protein